MYQKTIPADTPSYGQGTKKEKSPLDSFAEKSTIDGESGVIPNQYFAYKATQIKDFFRNHRNIKTRLVLVYLMEQKLIRDKKKTIFKQDKSYSHSLTDIHVEATDVKEILTKMIIKILKKKLLFIKGMVAVGILKKYSILKFILLIINQ